MVGKPGIGGYFAGPLFVVVIEIDFDGVGQLAFVKILGANAQESGVGDRQAAGFESKGDRALLDHGIDVMPPRIAIEEADDGELEFAAEALEEPADAARGLAAAVGENAVLFFPEAVFIEAVPDRSLFDVENEIRLAFLKLYDIGFDD